VPKYLDEDSNLGALEPEESTLYRLSYPESHVYGKNMMENNDKLKIN
jgi:hypothetical protein